MTTQEMLSKLAYSKNEIVAEKSQRIIAGITTIEEELKYCGSFMQCVLTGDYEMALKRADSANYEALTGQKKS